jgi:predicted nucleotidyltransferase
MKDKEIIFTEIKAAARTYIADAQVMLFGSRARDEGNPDSDYDILIVTEALIPSERRIALRTKIRKDLLMKGYRADVLIQNRSDIERKRRLPGHIIRNILKEAIVL